MKKSAPDNRLSKALALFDPPPAHRDRVAKNIQATLDQDIEPEFEWDSAGMTRYFAALRELLASRAALHPTTDGFLWDASVIKMEIREAEIMLEMRRRPSGQPPNERARRAVNLAGRLLMAEGHKLTTERKGKWHLLSQIVADTDRDLRHHLTASLRRKSAPLPPEVLAAVEMSRAENPKR
jgi:hypothetical protein